METIALDLENDNKTGLKDRHLDKSGTFKHRTSKQYKFLPFNTKWSHSFYNEFIYFNGILGEVFRNLHKKELPKSLKKSGNYHLELKNLLLQKASEKTHVNEPFERQKFKQFISDLFFEDDTLFCFDPSTLPYLSFRNEHATLNQISKFIYEIFLDNPSIQEKQNKVEAKTNILYKLIHDSLPELEKRKTSVFGYTRWHIEIIELFINDYLFLRSVQGSFLKNIDALLKHYFFIYVSKIALSCDDFCSPKEHELYFLMESETVSKNRDGYLRGWIHLEKRLGFIFAHANCLELLNYIKLDGQPIGNYQEIKSKYDALDEIQKVDLIHNINELERHYTDFIKELKISKLESYWDKYYKQLENDHKFQSISSPIEKVIYKFWFNINYQFLNTKRNKPYKDYSLWFIEFCKANFLKRRGRIGYTLKMDQEHLLFLTKLCIGVQPKIRLKTLWARLKMRGVNFDESSKMEIIKLFEKINLIDKKSDSGDAQYVRTIL